MSRPAIFLDRDGTVNVEKRYLYQVEDWEWIPGAIEAIREFNRAGFAVVVVSNQAGIAYGIYTEKEVDLLHATIAAELHNHGAWIDAFYYCPHHPQSGSTCDCRKPNPGMLFRAQRELDLDLARSYMIGDKLIDVDAGRAAGVRSVLVLTGYGRQEAQAAGAGPCVKDLLSACRLILKGEEFT